MIRSRCCARYTESIRMLGRDEHFPASLIADLEPLAGFRNVVIYEYVSLDLGRVVAALKGLDPVERFVDIVTRIQAE